ncbi:MAG: hypothetical protein LBF41_07230 [Deltaproteobacteria bacterium]|nr:hypothetical protein [Deltaproteobacteria bacterium]
MKNIFAFLAMAAVFVLLSAFSGEKDKGAAETPATSLSAATQSPTPATAAVSDGAAEIKSPAPGEASPEDERIAENVRVEEGFATDAADPPEEAKRVGWIAYDASDNPNAKKLDVNFTLKHPADFTLLPEEPDSLILTTFDKETVKTGEPHQTLLVGVTPLEELAGKKDENGRYADEVTDVLWERLSNHFGRQVKSKRLTHDDFPAFEWLSAREGSIGGEERVFTHMRAIAADDKMFVLFCSIFFSNDLDSPDPVSRETPVLETNLCVPFFDGFKIVKG